MTYPYLITDNAITVFVDQGYTVNRGDSRYESVDNAIRDGNFSIIPELLNLKGTILSMSNGELRLLNGMLMYNGEIVEPLLTSRIIEMREKNHNINPLLMFLENVSQNPSDDSKRDLYRFMEACDLPITADGYLLAYKMVTKDFLDIHSKSMDNSVGSFVEMDRESVDPDKDRTCSRGLHFCSKGYLGSYGCEGSSQVVILKINPRDVVSVPTDYDNAKGRACAYEVVGKLDWGDLIPSLSTDEYSECGDVPQDVPQDDVVTSVPYDRWELRNSVTGKLFESFASREGARKAHGINVNSFIFDKLNRVVAGGSVDSDVDFMNLDGKNVNDDRWELRDKVTSRIRVTFNSRKYAREYKTKDEFIWDNKNMVMVS